MMMFIPLSILLQMFFCCMTMGMELDLRQAYTKCSYPTGVLSRFGETISGLEDKVSLGDVAKCIAQSAVEYHGLCYQSAFVKDLALSVLQARWSNLYRQLKPEMIP